MADVDNLDNLTDAELRVKLREYGLPNVPVTDSSRKILVKKLRLTIGGVATPSKKTNRRETIHVANATTPQKSKELVEEKKKEATASASRNRRTVSAISSSIARDASPEPLVPVKPVQTVKANVTTQRRSTTREREVVIEKPTASVPNYPTVILEDDDDDNELVEAAQNVEKQRNYNANVVEADRDRRSRSVSLSKSGVLITSYNQELAPLSERREKDDYSDDEVEVVPNIVQPTNDVYSNYNFSSTSRNISTQPTRSYGSESSRLTYGGTNYNSVLPTYESSSLPSSKPITHRYSTTSAYPSTQTKPWKAGVSDDSDEAEGYIVDEEVADFETPYLSTFTRNLERLKADVGRSLVVKENTEFRRRYDTHYSSPILPRQPTRVIQKESTLMRTFVELDHRYHLKKFFAIFLLLLILIFLYVLFF